MPAYEVAVAINAPMEAVFARVADLLTHFEWSADPLDIAASEDGSFQATTRSRGKTFVARLSEVERRAPNLFVFDAADATGRWRHTFTMENADERTHLRRRISGELSGLQLVLYWLVLHPIKKPSAARALQRLKALLETG